MIMAITQTLVEQLLTIVGDDALVTDGKPISERRSDDVAGYTQAGHLIVFPESTDLVRAIVRVCNEHSVPIATYRSSASQSVLSFAEKSFVWIDLTRMDRVSLDYENRVAEVEAGMKTARLVEILARKGWQLKGQRCLERDVLGLEVVLHDGPVVDVGSHAADTCGYGLASSIFQSKGEFGVVTKLRYEIKPLAKESHTFLVEFDSVSSACGALTSILTQGYVVSEFHVLDRTTVSAVSETVPDVMYPSDADMVFQITVEGARSGVDDGCAQIIDVCRRSGARSVRMALSDKERNSLRISCAMAYDVVCHIDSGALVTDFIVPPSKFEEIIERIRTTCASVNITIKTLFNTNEMRLYIHAVYDESDAIQVGVVENTKIITSEYCLG